MRVADLDVLVRNTGTDFDYLPMLLARCPMGCGDPAEITYDKDDRVVRIRCGAHDPNVTRWAVDENAPGDDYVGEGVHNPAVPMTEGDEA